MFIVKCYKAAARQFCKLRTVEQFTLTFIILIACSQVQRVLEDARKLLEIEFVAPQLKITY
jgi:hypothetical protein